MSYLTTHDSMIECNLDSVYTFSENLSAHIQFGYVLNQMDMGAWNPSYRHEDLKRRMPIKPPPCSTTRFRAFLR